MSEQKDKTIATLQNALISLLFLICGWLYNANQKTEERLYQMQSVAMTTVAAQQLEDRLSRNFELRLSDISNRLDLILKLVQAQNGSSK